MHNNLNIKKYESDLDSYEGVNVNRQSLTKSSHVLEIGDQASAGTRTGLLMIRFSMSPSPCDAAASSTGRSARGRRGAVIQLLGRTGRTHFEQIEHLFQVKQHACDCCVALHSQMNGAKTIVKGYDPDVGPH